MMPTKAVQKSQEQQAAEALQRALEKMGVIELGGLLLQALKRKGDSFQVPWPTLTAKHAFHAIQKILEDLERRGDLRV